MKSLDLWYFLSAARQHAEKRSRKMRLYWQLADQLRAGERLLRPGRGLVHDTYALARFSVNWEEVHNDPERGDESVILWLSLDRDESMSQISHLKKRAEKLGLLDNDSATQLAHRVIREADMQG